MTIAASDHAASDNAASDHAASDNRPAKPGRRVARRVAGVGAICALALTGCAAPDFGQVSRPATSTPASTLNVAAPATTTPAADTTPTPDTPAATRAGTPESTPAATTPARPPATSASRNEVDAVMLTAGEIGSGFARTATTPPQPLPCTPHAASVDQQVQNIESARVNFDNTAGTISISEQVYVYGSQTAAVRHQQIDEAGLSCARGTAAGAAIDIAGPYNVAGDIAVPQADKAQVWSLSNTDVNAELFLVRINGVVIQFSFVADARIKPTVNVKRVIRTALHKILEHS